MFLQYFIFVSFAYLAGSANKPEVTYSRVSKNGEESHETKNSPVLWTSNNLTTVQQTKGRGVQGISITVSPIYVPPKTPRLGNGEAVDYLPPRKYSTIDQEALSKIEGSSSRRKPQDRFSPSANFDNGGKKNRPTSLKDSGASGTPNFGSASSGITFSKPTYLGAGDFSNWESDSKPAISVDGYSSMDPNSKIPASYVPESDPFEAEGPGGGFDSGPGSRPTSFEEDSPPKANNYGELDEPPFIDDSYFHEHDHRPHRPEIVYDRPPELQHHFHHHDDEQDNDHSEENDQRVNKRPYSYYYIGRKLWYIPLYFSIYFIVYIAALVLKSIARHKIDLPENLHNAVSHHDHDHHHERSGGMQIDTPGWMDGTVRVLESIENAAKKFG
ncbi:uncharacterized protein LOC105698700 [Orussus abietinus]|uniref:uncharacterized protein LOC105698700 n=1 Tax=Orussus abietinus TaxID=222816 RepID=UPI000C715B50|nr:uncharacterized protein LOC105698700 [Orussus abietinus]